MDAHHQKVTERFKEWQRCRANLQDHSQRLEKAMQEYVAGTEPLPSALTEEVRALRKECDALFAQVLDAMNDRARSAEQKLQ
jgi:uncharacterized coiled-coil DUF342 family protein